MIKATVLYGPPADAPAFEEHYLKTHVPLAETIPGVHRFETSKVLGAGDGGEAPYHRIAEMWFESPETMRASMTSEEGRATNADVANFATGGVTIVISAVD